MSATDVQWETTTIRIVRLGGVTEHVTGDVCAAAPGLAVTDAIGANRAIGQYAVTHVASGCKFALFDLRERAQAFVLAIAPFADWTGGAEALRTDKRLAAAVRRIAATSGAAWGGPA